MAQAMLLMPSVSTTNTNDLKKDALLKLQIQKIKPKSSSSHLFFSPLPSLSSSSSSSPLKTLALFKSKPKTPPKKVEKPKLKVEDGLFGTSGGIGFTKENELFVGRVAMLGFAEIAKDQSKEASFRLLKHYLVPPMMALLVALVPVSYTPASLAIDAPKAAALFRRACIGCHDTGGNVIQPGATLFSNDLQRNGVDSEEDIFNITYNGKGRMPGFGEKCMPRGQCTFGPRLQDHEIRLLAQFASLLGEGITGKGILAQLNLETGIPIYEAEPLLLFFILFTLLGAIGALGDRGRFVDDPPTGLEKAVIPPGKGVRSALGLKEGGPLFGFTKSNELFVGRLAQLGFGFSLIGEIITGKGALAQLNIETGVPINEIEPLVLLNVLFFFIAAINPGTGKFITDEEEE
ncbi:Photosystem II 22 kDa protein chloroplastic [Bienertia sinuspersici]